METNPISLTVRVLGYTEGSFKGKDGADIEYNTALVRFDGLVLKMGSKANLESYLDKDVALAVEVKRGLNDAPKLTIVGIAGAKA